MITCQNNIEVATSSLLPHLQRPKIEKGVRIVRCKAKAQKKEESVPKDGMFEGSIVID